MKCSFGISNFLEEISSLSYSIFFLLFLCTDHQGRLSYLALLSFETVALNGYIFPFLLCILFFFFSQLFVRSPQTTILPFCISFSWGWFWSPPPVQCWNSIYSSSSTLSDLILASICHFHCIVIKDWFRSFLKGLVTFPSFFHLYLNLARRSSWSEPQSAPGLVFADYIELLHLQLQRI